MEVVVTADQDLLRTTTRAFLEASCPLPAVRACANEPLGYDRDLWRQGAELGWTSLLVSEADGGGSVSGDGLADLVLVAGELGRLVAPGPWLPTNLVASALAGWAEGDQRRAVLAELLAGTATAACTATGCGVPGEVHLRDGAPGGDLVLQGEALPVDGAPGAAWLLVAAHHAGGLTQVLVPADAPGVVVEPLDGLDLVRRFARVRFDGVAVPRTAVVGEVGAAAADLVRQLHVAVVLQCAETVGALGEIFGRTIAYLGDRYSFGRPLASYQALKHRCADWELALERSRATLAAAARAVASSVPEADELASVAKAFIGPVATELVQDCVQLHGGIGVTWDHDLHLYLRRVSVNRATYGTPEEHLERVAAHLFESAA